VAEPFLSASWYRVEALKPRLAGRARIHRHRYRGQAWYVIEDEATGRAHRFTPAAYALLGRMDGTRTLDAIWKEAAEALGRDAPGQDEVVRLLSQLHAADLLACEVNPDTAELFRRHAKQAGQGWKRNLKNPFSIRIPLWDPDRFLTRTLPWVGWMFGRRGFILWLVVAAAGATTAAVHWSDLTGNLADRVLSAGNLVVLFLVFPVVKALHELGHGYAAKRAGGEVHDMGILLLVFMPVPYVDASSANAFRSKWHRAVVGAAGMLVEMFVASIAMLLWALAEPGIVRAVAFNVMLIAGVSTLIFNGNPLLRYDGYYILCDLVEIPNLGRRANEFWKHLLERHAFRLTEREPFDATPGERAWFAGYAPLSFVYRAIVVVGIILFVAGEFYVIGVILAIWGIATMVLWPAAKGLWYLWTSPRLGTRRSHALRVSGAAIVVLAALVAFVPMPLRTQTEGVVWLPEDAHVRAGADGFVRRVLAVSGEPVRAGDVLIEAEDPVLAVRIRVQEAKVEELTARYEAQRFTERAQAEITRQALGREQTTLARERERAERLIVRSRAGGVFVLPNAADLPGRHFRQGQLLGYVVEGPSAIVRVVVGQDDIDLVRTRLERAEVKLAHRVPDTLPATVVREVPAAAGELPSPALGTEGGGTHASDPRDTKGVRTLATLFQFDLVLPPGDAQSSFGTRAYVRFVHVPEPLGRQWYRRARQLFLARFHV